MVNGVETFRLPFNDRWFVAHAGDTPNVNHHVRVRAQWYGVDFLKTGGLHQRQLVRNEGKTVEDFFSWGETVRSPVKGKLEVVMDGLPDNPIGVSDKQNTCGNHVVIRTKTERYVFIAHLQRGSVCVKQGEEVKAGQQIGLCGNSGNTSGPHIHLHTQDTPIFNQGTGQNMFFHHMHVEMTGRIFKDVTWPLIRGLFVWPNGA